MNLTDQLTFEPNSPERLNLWLANLKKLNSSQAGNELNQALLKLRRNPPQDSVKLAILDELLGVTQFYADQLEASVLSKALKLRALEIKTAKLSTQLLLNLTINYAQVSTTGQLAPEQQLMALFLTQHLVGLTLKKQALFKQCPASKLWKISADTYRFAKESRLLTTQMPNAKIFKFAQKNLLELFKRNLLFSILSPYRFELSEIHELFKLAERHSTLLQINDSATAGGFIWHLNQASPPIPVNTIESIDSEVVYLSGTDVIKALKNAPLLISKPELTVLFHRLSGYQDIIDSMIPTAPKHYQLIIEDSEIHTHLAQHATLNNILRISSESRDKPVSNLQLQIEPFNAPNSASNRSNQLPNLNNSVIGAQVAIYNTRLANFVLGSLSKQTVQIDQPVLLVKFSEAPKLGIVRQVSLNKINNSRSLLIELNQHPIESVNIKINQQSLSALMLKNAPDSIELLVPPGEYPNNSAIECNSNALKGRYYFDELIEFTVFFMRFRILADL